MKRAHGIEILAPGRLSCSGVLPLWSSQRMTTPEGGSHSQAMIAADAILGL